MKNLYKNYSGDFPGDPVVKNPYLHSRGSESLIRELKSQGLQKKVILEAQGPLVGETSVSIHSEHSFVLLSVFAETSQEREALGNPL